MILSAQTIKFLKLVNPLQERTVIRGRSSGLSLSGVDITINETFYLEPGEFKLASSIEQFNMTKDVMGFVKDKSSWARRGLSVFNTVIEPGWTGYLTIELVNHGYERLRMTQGDPIAQVVFQYINAETGGYRGKYQGQETGPQEARYEV